MSFRGIWISWEAYMLWDSKVLCLNFLKSSAFWCGLVTDSMDVSLGELQELVMDRKAWGTAIHGVTKSRTRLSDWTELMSPKKTDRWPTGTWKRCSISLIFREMQIKTTVRYRLTLVRTVWWLVRTIIKKSTNNKYWKVCGEKGTFLHCWWEYKLVQPLWKQYEVSSKNWSCHMI